MEYCALGDLSMFISRRDHLGDHAYTRDMIAKYPNPPGGALNEVIVRHFLKQLASSLKFLRDRNLIHRDIKPQNLLLCPSPTSYRTGVAHIIPYKCSEDSYEPLTGLRSLPMLKIADFGFARSLPATSLAETLCGSPLYMAPEILRYEKYDAKADLWSVGAVLHEMVAGRPPFRAANHVDLLRKIEKGGDKVKFPDDNPVSKEIKTLIRMLLKRNPVERMTFRDFFESPIIQGVIPGLVGDDLQPSSEEAASGERQEGPTAEQQQQQGQQQRRPETISRPSSGTPPTMRRMGSVDRSSPSSETNRAVITGRQELVDRQRSTAAVRRSPPPAPSTTTTDKQNVNEIRERAMQDVAFERDYVLVEKRAVEVNAFADELAHSPRFQPSYASSQRRGHQTGMVTARNTPPTNNNINNNNNNNPMTTTPPSPPSNATKAVQILPGRGRPEPVHHRQASFERRYGGHSPGSATSAISKALNLAGGRLFGVGFSPPTTMGISKGGRSPPLAYNPFPAYPAPGGYLMALEDGTRINIPADEDTRTVQVIEDCATRSNVVYGFAEVKFKQLVPLAPSSVPLDSPIINKHHDLLDDSDAGLTVDATVALSEEALVLYVKALALCAKAMDIAGNWWARKNRGEIFTTESSATTGETAVGARVNDVVQWVRSRFNEVLEKAEFVRLKLIEAQKRLPVDDPSHPNNQSVSSSSTTAGGGTSVDVFVSAGVSAEKLMYDRALEMSRAAAINELTSEDLPGCEVAYVTAIRMLEAVLEDDEVPKLGSGGSSSNKKDDERQAEHRMVVLKCKLGPFFFFFFFLTQN